MNFKLTNIQFSASTNRTFFARKLWGIVRNRLLNKYKLHVEIESVQFYIGGIRLFKVRVFDAKQSISVESEEIRLTFKKLFRPLTIGLKIVSADFLIDYAKRSTSLQNTTSNTIQDKFFRYFDYLFTKISQSRKIKVNKIEIQKCYGKFLTSTLQSTVSWDVLNIYIANKSTKFNLEQFYLTYFTNRTFNYNAEKIVGELRSDFDAFHQAITVSNNIQQLKINDDRFSTSVVNILSVETQCNINRVENKLELSDTYFNIMGSKLLINCNYVLPAKIELNVNLIIQEIQDLLKIFTSFKNKEIYKLNLTGPFSISSDFEWELSNPEGAQCKIDIESLITSKFFDRFDLSYLNKPFSIFPVYDPQYPRFLGESNTNFVAIKNVPELIKKTFIMTEDGTFYTHHGFDLNAFSEAINLNITSRNLLKLLQGASTITMQLARNLLLNHDKNIARKIEELFVTWLISDIYKISKERQLEIYINIIEFGANIYGLKEACEFYFEKEIWVLDLPDILVLTYIIPRPKYFLEAFQMKSNQLITNLNYHFKFISFHLHENLIISDSEYENLAYRITLPKFGELAF